MKTLRIAVSMLLAVPVLALAEDDIVITQEGRQFSRSELSIERGASVTFVNKDRMRHNIALKTPEGQEQTGIVQAPGDSNALTFDKQGLYQVHCLIHPGMRLAVQVQ